MAFDAREPTFMGSTFFHDTEFRLLSPAALPARKFIKASFGWLTVKASVVLEQKPFLFCNRGGDLFISLF